MCKRQAFSLGLAVALGLATATARADLIAYYPFDEGSGTTVADMTGNGNDGTFNGSVEWVPGVMGTAVRLDTAGERVVLNELDPTAANDAMTLAAWIKWEGADHASITHQGIFGKRQGWDPRTYVKWFWEAQPDGDLAFRNGDAAVTASGVLDAYSNEWAHVALTWDNGAVVQYINAEEVDTGTMTFRDTADATVMTVGCVSSTNNETFVGSIDDARIYDTVLMLDELVRAMEGTPPDLAYGPEPRDGAMIEATWIQLEWKAGACAVTHDVYMGTDYDAVSAGAEATFLGNVDEPSILVGTTGRPFPDGLQPGTTYYWRVDEVNDVNDNSPWTGDVWSFWLPPKTAYGPTPADGVPFVALDMQLSWSPGMKAFMRVVYFGTDANEVASATGNFPQIDTTYDPGPLETDTPYYWRVDEFDGMQWSTGPVWNFRTLPEITVGDPTLVLWWTLEEGAGLTAVDWSGHGHHGAIHGNAQWVLGYQDTALTFEEDAYVEAAGYPGVTGTDPRTLCAWIKTDVANTNMTIMSWGENATGQKWRMRQDTTGGLRIEVNGGYHYGVTNIGDGNWHHVAVTFEDDGSPDVLDTLLYVDGQLDTTLASQATAVDTATTGAVRIGESPWHNAPWQGLIDDARIYAKVLTEQDLRHVMRGNPLMAWDFQPPDGRTVDIRDVTALSWRAGDLAAEHDVYLGFDPNAVFNADAGDTTGIYRGRQTGTAYTPAEGFAWGRTHYWRIDEINTDGTITKGGVRTFTIADFLPVDDFESYTDDNMALEAIFQTWLDGWGYTEPQPVQGNGTGSTVGYIEAPFAEQTIVHGGNQSMPLEYDNSIEPWYSETERTWAVPQNWAAAEVTDLSIWVRGNPVSFLETPPDGITMSAAGADIYQQTDEFRFAYKRLNGNGSITVQVESLENTHDWAKAGVMIRQGLSPVSQQVDMIVSPTGRVEWMFRPTIGATTTAISLPANSAPLPHWVRITRQGNTITGEHSADGQAWQPLTAADGTPSSVDLIMAGDIYIGLAVTSHNAGTATTAVFSNIQTSGNVVGQWQVADIGVDHPGNDPDQLYVAVQDSAGRLGAAVHPDPGAVLATDWTEWRILLSEFTSAGVNLGAVKKMIIGVGDRNTPSPDGAGMLYIDEITLRRSEPAVETVE